MVPLYLGPLATWHPDTLALIGTLATWHLGTMAHWYHRADFHLGTLLLIGALAPSLLAPWHPSTLAPWHLITLALLCTLALLSTFALLGTTTNMLFCLAAQFRATALFARSWEEQIVKSLYIKDIFFMDK